MSKRGIDGDLVGIDDATARPDLPAWHIIQRTTHQGAHVQGVPRAARRVRREQEAGDPAVVGRAALRRDARAEDAAGARRAPRRRQVGREPPGVSPARAPRAVSPLLAYDGGGASPLLDPVDDEPNPGSQALRTAKTRFKELNDSCVDCVVRVPTSEIVDESSALYLNGGDGDGDGEGDGGAAEGAEGGGEAAAGAEGAAEGGGAGGAGAGDGAAPGADTSNDAAIASGGGGDAASRRATGAAGGARGGVGRAGAAAATVSLSTRTNASASVRPTRPTCRRCAAVRSRRMCGRGGRGRPAPTRATAHKREAVATIRRGRARRWNGRALDDGAVSDYIRAATAKLKDGADITKATDGAAADGAAAAFSAAIDGAAAERAVDALSAAGQESALCLLHEHGYRPDAALARSSAARRERRRHAPAGAPASSSRSTRARLAREGLHRHREGAPGAWGDRARADVLRAQVRAGALRQRDPNFLYARPGGQVAATRRRAEGDEEADGDGAPATAVRRVPRRC